MEILGATLVVILFAVLIQVLRFVERTGEVIAISRQSVEAMRNETLTERQKESLIQKHSLQLFRLLGILLAGSAIALFVPLGLIWLTDWVGILNFQAVVAILLRWDFIIAACFIGVTAYYLTKRLHK